MIAVLSGGVGGSRFIRALASIVDAASITAIINTGDDHEFHGLHVSPDPDIVTYALAGKVDDDKGWGLRGDTFRWNEHLARFGRETWFQVGDLDLATHVYRTEQLRSGKLLSEVTTDIARAFGVAARLLPMTDDSVRTVIETADGDQPFQRYLVERHATDPVMGIRFDGAGAADPAPGVIAAILEAEAIFIAPSNPIASIWPILAIPGVRDAIERTDAPVIAVSPIIGGRSLQPPAAELMAALGFNVDPSGVASCYEGLIDLIIVDEADEAVVANVTSTGVRAVITRTLMTDPAIAAELAVVALESAGVKTVAS